MNNISFGAKIPVGKCQILDCESRKFVDATFCQYDGQDLQDVFELSRVDCYQDCKDAMKTGLQLELLGISNPGFSYYCLKDNNGEIVGLCYTFDENGVKKVKYIASVLDGKHKYIGQAMLASLAKKCLNSNSQKFVIEAALSSAWDFYANTCGFEPIGDTPNLQMDRYGMFEFVRKVEDRTKGKVIDFCV
ncbi:MAG: hypothetical protein IKL52_07530 [Candidatus Gastranaerophilales bacterium]|nr:hypothetical protein [Candidatus Gastranaerophilales bacterium]